MIDWYAFKEQLHDFIKLNPKPFDIDYLLRHANVPIDRYRIHNALIELMEEGHVTRLSDGRWISVYAISKKWIRKEEEIKVPEYLIEEIRFALLLRPLYRSIEDFIIAAIKKLLEETKRKHINQSEP